MIPLLLHAFAHIRRVFLILGSIVVSLVFLGLLAVRWAAAGLTELPLPHAALAMVGVLPVLLAMTAAMMIAAWFLHDLYAIGSFGEAHDFLSRLLFGPWTNRPKLVVKEGRLARGEGSLLHRVGGPGFLSIDNDSAVVTEQYGRLARVLSAHLPAENSVQYLEPFEKIWEIVDLRPQRWVKQVEAITREGIPITCELDVSFKIDDRIPDERGRLLPKQPTDQEPYPYTPEAVLKAALAQWIRDPDSPGPPIDWAARTVNGRIEGALRNILAEYRLDWLVAPTGSDVEHSRETIRKQLIAIVEGQVADGGARILSLDVGDVNPQDAEIPRQWIEAWQAEWESRALSRQIEGEAELLRMDAVRVQAQAEMVITLVQALQSVATTDEEVRPYLLATRFVEALRWMSYNPLTRAFMPPEAMQTLRQLQDALRDERTAQLHGWEEGGPPVEEA